MEKGKKIVIFGTKAQHLYNCSVYICKLLFTIGDKMAETEIIRIHKPTKLMLERLKIVMEESFDSVIRRMIQTRYEEDFALSAETKGLLDKRMKNVSEGKVFSSSELLERIRSKRAQKDGV